MRKSYIVLFLFYCFLVLPLEVKSQTKGIAYQAVIFNPNAKAMPGVSLAVSPLVNTAVCLRFSFLDSVGENEYQEILKVATDNFGIVNTVIGLGPQTGGYVTSFDKISWSNGTKAIVVELDVKGSCSSFEEISRQNFATVPYAYNSENANNVTGVVPIEHGGTGATTVNGVLKEFGLDKVNNTSDLNKPVSNATAQVLSTKEDIVNKEVDLNADPTSNLKYPTVKAVKTYVDSIKGKLESISLNSTTPTGAIVGSMFYNSNPNSDIPLGPVFFDGTKWQPFVNVNQLKTTNLTSNYTVLENDHTLFCDTSAGGFTITLPTPSSTNKGRVYIIVKTDDSPNELSIVPNLKISNTIFTSIINFPDSIRIQSDGTDWFIIK